MSVSLFCGAGNNSAAFVSNSGEVELSNNFLFFSVLVFFSFFPITEKESTSTKIAKRMISIGAIYTQVCASETSIGKRPTTTGFLSNKIHHIFLIIDPNGNGHFSQVYRIAINGFDMRQRNNIRFVNTDELTGRQ